MTTATAMTTTMMRAEDDARARAELAAIFNDSTIYDFSPKLLAYLRAYLSRIESPSHLRYLLRMACYCRETNGDASRELTTLALRQLTPLWDPRPDIPSLSRVCEWIEQDTMTYADIGYMRRGNRATRIAYRVARTYVTKEGRSPLKIATHSVADELGRAAPPEHRRRARASVYRVVLEDIARRLELPPPREPPATSTFIEWLIEVSLITLRPGATTESLEVAMASILRRPVTERGVMLANHLIGDPEVLEVLVNAEMLDVALEAWGP